MQLRPRGEYPEIALACSGLGEIRRGYERYYEDLYGLVREDISVVLYHGGRNGPGIWLPRVSRNSRMTRVLRSWEARYELELLSFEAALLPVLSISKVKLLHFSDYSLGVLGRLPKWAFSPALLFTNGSRCPPEAYKAFDFIHLVNPFDYELALDSGIAQSRLYEIPHGVDTEKFRPPTPEQKEQARKIHGLSNDCFVVASVGHIGVTSEKRFDYLIQEISAVPGEPTLIVAGDLDYDSGKLYHSACKRLGKRVKILSLPPGQMPSLYATADLFALTSLQEAFGIVLIEAMACGLPVLAHNSPTIKWIVGGGGSIIDMTSQGLLAAEIQYQMDNPPTVRDRGRVARSRAMENFSWPILKQRYLEMYRRCLESL